MEKVEKYVALIHETLLDKFHIIPTKDTEPILIQKTPKNWQLIGTGNYCAVFSHHEYPNWVVKVYLRKGSDAKTEALIYRKIGKHKHFSHLIHESEQFIVLKRINGVTLYDAIHKGIKIPPQVFKDVEQALSYAKKRGLRPNDVHGKNILMENGRGYVIDVSDFLFPYTDRIWNDLKTAYEKIYLPIFYHLPIRVPYFVLNGIRHGYRFTKLFHKRKYV